MPRGRKRKYTKKFIREFMSEFLEWMKQEENVWMKDFYILKGISRQRVQEFLEILKALGDDKGVSEFEDTMSLIKEIQESKLAKRGLTNDFNARLVEFCLINHHDYTSRNEVKHSGGITLSDIFDDTEIDEEKEK